MDFKIGDEIEGEGQETSNLKVKSKLPLIIIIVVSLIVGLLVFFLSNSLFGPKKTKEPPVTRQQLNLKERNVDILYGYVTYGEKKQRNDKFVKESKVTLDSFSDEEKFYYALQFADPDDFDFNGKTNEQGKKIYVITERKIRNYMQRFFGNKVTYSPVKELKYTFNFLINSQNTGTLKYSEDEKSYNIVFDEYIDQWYAVKEKSTGAIKQIAKLMLNNLYGKFATAPEIIEKVPVIEDDAVKYVVSRRYIRDAIYVPVGIFCTAYARNKTIRTAQMEYDRFIYADTDSVHLNGDYEPEEMRSVIDDKKLGYWKNESNFVRARFLKAKTYIEEEKTTKDKYIENINSKEPNNLIYKRGKEYYYLNVKCAGMNDAVKQKVTWDNFKKGFSEDGKLVPVNVPGGVVLESREFTIKDFEINKIVE